MESDADDVVGVPGGAREQEAREGPYVEVDINAMEAREVRGVVDGGNGDKVRREDVGGRVGASNFFCEHGMASGGVWVPRVRVRVRCGCVL